MKPEPHARRDAVTSTKRTSATGKYVITQQALDKLLVCLAPDRNEAGVQFEAIRTKLVRFFEWRSVVAADQYADETLDRVARRIDEGQEVKNLRGYIYGVARMVLKEEIREREREFVPIEEIGDKIPDESPPPIEPEAREVCFDRCLDKLAPESRSLILDYYQEERRAKIELRQQLADRLRIPQNALRIRAHRIRIILEKCIVNCLQSAPGVK
jgi:DNA-directed RNA polymerase specialized sigma24 family protein